MTRTPSENRLSVASNFSEITSMVLLPYREIHEALSPESIEILTELSGVVHAVAEALQARDEIAAYREDGRSGDAPRRMPSIDVEAAERITEVAAMLLQAAEKEKVVGQIRRVA